MRSLEEWTKYLEQQEQAFQRTFRDEPAPRESEPAANDQPAEEIRRPSEVAAFAVPKPPEVILPTPVQRSPGAAEAKPVLHPPRRESPPQDQMSLMVDGEPIGGTPVEKAVRLRRQLPRHLLGIDGRQEIAQSSYKTFKETREELLHRLLDPQISLEEAARILNVCPTTVRRYTNKGLLKHIRTPGNQRRFRLSDVLAFLESHSAS